LANLDDLILLMDESHHYRADRGMQVINELNPIAGLELTATPQVERAGGAIKFKNVVYEYSLARAIKDGFVKEPAVATRKDFDPAKYSAEDLDLIKLEDGLHIHEDTKVALDIYARNNKATPVKPFVLVVAQNTDHAGRLMALIKSTAFFNGRYADKVMEIHSNQTGSEKEENIQQLLSLESPDNKIEIVIHVNMLKEGWDVTNLYTIIPLRTAASLTLREQTIGRGLRLPYGKRTDSAKVDKLTIVAHDKFQAIVDAANLPDSIIRKENIIEIEPEELRKEKEVVVSAMNVEEKIVEEQKRIDQLPESEAKQKAQVNLEARKVILDIIPELNRVVKSVDDLKTVEVKQLVIEKYKEKLSASPQEELFAQQMITQVEAAYESVVDEFTAHMIEIPRVTIQPTAEVKSGFRDFNLDVRHLNYQPVSEEILRQTLQNHERDIISGKEGGGIIHDRPEKIIVNELMNFAEIDYDQQTDLLFKLAGQAVAHFDTYLDDGKIENVVQAHKKEIGRYIYAQLMEHFEYSQPDFEKTEVLPFTRIEQHNYEKLTSDKIHHFTETIELAHEIPSKLFSGFQKACHRFYKFRSKTEKDLSIILEHDRAVEKWLRPGPGQFNIYWDHNSRRYEPDFVVESKDCIYLIETKREMDMDSREVELKARAALEYCQRVTEYTTANRGKPWIYVLIPHNAVMANMSFFNLTKRYEYKPSAIIEVKKSDLRFSDIFPEGADADQWLPIYTLAAACGKFSGEVETKEERWIYVGCKFDAEYFVVRAIGESMKPKINDGDYCIFKANPSGPYSGQGRIYLFQYQGEPDPDTGGSYTIKGYQSYKGTDGFNISVKLIPFNKAYAPMEFKSEDGDIDRKLNFVAEFIKIIE
jgi:type III restriction enzyme